MFTYGKRNTVGREAWKRISKNRIGHPWSRALFFTGVIARSAGPGNFSRPASSVKTLMSKECSFLALPSQAYRPKSRKGKDEGQKDETVREKKVCV